MTISAHDKPENPEVLPEIRNSVRHGRDIANAVHVTSWLSRQGGGIPAVIWNLAREHQKAGVNSWVAGLIDEWSSQEIPGGLKVVEGAITGPPAFGYSPELSVKLQAILERGSVVHSHGLWMHPGVIARQLAVKARCALVITPHGMLEPWALRNSQGKKRIAGWLFENKNLRAADCLHALCDAEAESFRRYGLKNPIAIISNGIDLDVFESLPEGESIIDRFPAARNRKRLLFLSRLHPKKGLEILLESWRQLAADLPDWCLLIAGSGLPEYEQQLRDRVRGLGLEASVVFLGALHGPDRLQALAAADAFVLPSFSEGFSMAILEAAAARLPVLLTQACNFPELAHSGGGIEVPVEPEAVKTGLRHLMDLSDVERKTMGDCARKLVEQQYTWKLKARQMLEVYDWLAGSAAKPPFVRLDQGTPVVS